MYYAKYLAPLAILTLFLSVAGFARDKNSATLQLNQPALVGTTHLQPGTYKVEWNGSGPTVNVNILQHKMTVASTTAELRTKDTAAAQDAVVLKPSPNNASEQEITEIDMAKHKEVLLLNQNSMNPGQ